MNDLIRVCVKCQKKCGCWRDGRKEDCESKKCDKKCPEDVAITGMICNDCLEARNNFYNIGHA